jgi:hypothetical protein
VAIVALPMRGGWHLGCVDEIFRMSVGFCNAVLWSAKKCELMRGGSIPKFMEVDGTVKGVAAQKKARIAEHEAIIETEGEQEVGVPKGGEASKYSKDKYRSPI